MDYAIKNSIFANLQFFADSKSRAQELSNDVSFVRVGHQIWDLERGGVKLTPRRDRVKLSIFYKISRSTPGTLSSLKISYTYPINPFGKLKVHFWKNLN